MKFYSYKYKVSTTPEKAFDYFSNKEYLVKYFSQKEKDKIVILSENMRSKIIEGEEIKLLVREEDYSLQIVVKVEEIIDRELIRYNLEFSENIVSKNYEDTEQYEDFISLMKKLGGFQIVSKVEFIPQEEHLLIREYSEVLVNKIWKKILWKIIGLHFQLKQRNIHKLVKMELEKE